MDKKQAVTYLRFSGFSDEQIKAIEGAFSCPSAGVDCEDCPAYEDAISRKAVTDAEYQTIDINGVEYVMLSEVQMKMRKLPPVVTKEERALLQRWRDNRGVSMEEFAKALELLKEDKA